MIVDMVPTMQPYKNEMPQKEVAVGSTWKIADAAAQGFCGFDGLVSQQLTCKLEEVKDALTDLRLRQPLRPDQRTEREAQRRERRQAARIKLQPGRKRSGTRGRNC